MIDAGDEPHLDEGKDVTYVETDSVHYLWSGHGIVLWQEQLQFENSALKWRPLGSCDHDMEISGVVVVRNSGDARNRFLHQSLSFLDNSSW